MIRNGNVNRPYQISLLQEVRRIHQKFTMRTRNTTTILFRASRNGNYTNLINGNRVKRISTTNFRFPNSLITRKIITRLTRGDAFTTRPNGNHTRINQYTTDTQTRQKGLIGEATRLKQSRVSRYFTGKGRYTTKRERPPGLEY